MGSGGRDPGAAILRSIGSYVRGYRGDYFRLYHDTLVWIAGSGADSGDVLVGIHVQDGMAVLRTERGEEQQRARSLPASKTTEPAPESPDEREKKHPGSSTAGTPW